MEGSSSKDYMLQEFDHDVFLQLYCNPGKYPSLYEELVLFPLRHAMQNIHLVKSTGGTLYDLSFGPNILHLILFCEYFSDIHILELNESCLKAVEKWLKKEENAPDCAGGAQFLPDLGISSLNLSVKEDFLRGKVKSIKKYDLSCTEASVPQKADCLLCIYMLEHVSVDEESLLRNLKAIGSNIKIGGILLASGVFNYQLFTIGEKKVNTFPYDEILLRRCMKDAGFNIIILETLKSKIDSAIIQYDELWCAAAIREREV
ncbi:nicotinamide N-methyltransferase-like isoform X1 [Eleutherodactylus coqui]|uniref:nicotinamide N-methyltransferase-like isoform X1 n=1 Tax=Eleutherodactylus coqui TaxID=57060 RepID=UPI003461BE89